VSFIAGGSRKYSLSVKNIFIPHHRLIMLLTKGMEWSVCCSVMQLRVKAFPGVKWRVKLSNNSHRVQRLRMLGTYRHSCSITCHEGSGGIAPLFPNTGTRWKPVSFTPSCGKLSPYPLNKRLKACGPQSRSGRFGEETNHLHSSGIETRFLDFPSHNKNTWSCQSLHSPCNFIFMSLLYHSQCKTHFLPLNY
jgi:hypothetical protein